VRVVLDLKSEVKRRFFTLEPIGEYGHRLVLDIYPVEPLDRYWRFCKKRELKTAPGYSTTEPLMSTNAKRAGHQTAAGGPSVDRLVTIAVDAGHGGRIRGPGRRGTRENSHPDDRAPN